MGRTNQSLPIEVAAGSRKQYRFVVPPGFEEIEVRVEEPGGEPLRVRPPNRPGTGEYLVGVMGLEPAALPPLRSETTGRSGAWVGLDPMWLDTSHLALQPISAVVTNAEAIAGLGERARTNLAAGIAAGTDLVLVDHAVDAPLPPDLGLPWRGERPGWTMTAGDLTPAGRAGSAADAPIAASFAAGEARIVVTPVEPGEAGLGSRSGEFWSLVAQPAGRGGSDESTPEYLVTATAFQFARLFSEQGGQRPVVPGLGAFVVAYVAVVGPINALVLRRFGRRELAWATVPLVTVVFTAGAFLGATTARPPSGGAVRLSYWTDGAGAELLAAGVRTPTPGVRTVTLPGPEWTVRTLVDSGQGGTIARGEDTAVSMDLTALQLGGVAAWRATAAPPPLDVTAVGTARGVRVTVANTSGRRLDAVTVRAASSSKNLRTLEAGQSREVELGHGELPQVGAHRDGFDELFGVDGAVSPPESMRAVLNTEIADGRPGMAWVSAVDPAAPAIGAQTEGGALEDRGTMIAVGVRVEGSRPLSPFSVDRDVFAAGDGGWRPGPEAIEGPGEIFLRYRLPPDAPLAQMSNHLDRNGQSGGNPEMAVWDRAQQQWTPAEEAFAGNREDLVGPLGDVWARASGEMFPFEYSARTIAGSRS